MASTLIIGARGRIGLADNVRYASSSPGNGAPVAGHTEKLAVVAEGEIKVLNTWANGRENSHGRGNYQTNPDSTNIVLNGVYVALNESFTFEQQNDADSGYVCPCTPDDRGTVYLHGSLIQKRRGHLHRSTLNSTGYLRYHRYDEALRDWDLHLFDARENSATPENLDFGEVAVGEIVMDTLVLGNDYIPIRPESLRVAPPFSVVALTEDSFAWNHRYMVQFQPTEAGVYADTLRWWETQYGRWYGVPVAGQATVAAAGYTLALLPGTYTLSASPNPFNAQTRLSFTVPRAGVVALKIYDTLGREVATLWDGALEAGTRTLNFDGAALGTGLYFARLQTDEGAITQKLLLLK